MTTELRGASWSAPVLWRFGRENHSVWKTVLGAAPKTATGKGALPSKVPAVRPKTVWGGRTAFEHLIGRGDGIKRKDAKTQRRREGGEVAERRNDNKLKEPNAKDESFEEVVKSAQEAAALVLVY